MLLIVFITGLICGNFLPHAPVYARIVRHFIKCMDERDKEILKQRRVIMLLKLMVVKADKNGRG